MIGWKTIGNFLSQWYHEKWWDQFWAETLKKVFSNEKKMASKKIFWHFLPANCFMFILSISNHTVFLFQFGNNLYLWVFQKAQIALAEAAPAISAFWKTHLCKLIPNWIRNRMITATYSQRQQKLHKWFCSVPPLLKSRQVMSSSFRQSSSISHRLVSKGALRKIKTTW